MVESEDCDIMQKDLTMVGLVNEDQIAFGLRIGLDLKGRSVRVASALIEELIDVSFHGKTLPPSTNKQCDLGMRFGFNLRGMSVQVAGAVIGDIMEQLDRETIRSENLEPGIVVTNIYDKRNVQYVISSIQPDLMVYFKGGNGKKAYARSLRKFVGVADKDG